MTWRPLLTDGAVKSYHALDADGNSVVKTTQDVEPVIERNKKLQNEPKSQVSMDWSRWVASIPNVVALKWMKEDGINWMRLPRIEKNRYLKRKLDDPDWRYLKTTPGKF